MHKKWDRDMIHFSGRRHTKTGVLSTILGIAVILGFITISILSGIARGQGGLIYGCLGLFLFGMAVFGFVLSYKSFKKKDIFYHFPIIGAALNGFMAIVLLIIYILGFGG